VRYSSDKRHTGVEESNKRRATAFVFSRQPSFDETPTSTTTPPELRRIKQLPHSSNAPSLKTSVYPPRTQADTSGSSERGLYGIGPGPSQDPKVAIPSNNVSTLSAPGEFQIPPPRRFHISRSAVPTNPLSPSTSGVRRKRKVEPTIFVERRKKPRTPAEEASSKTNNNNNNDDDDSATTLVSEPQVFRQQKKPGRAARTATPPLSSSTTLKPSAAPLRNVRLPSGAVIPWDVNSDQLAAEMEAYTLQEIGKNIAQAEAETAKPKIASSPRRSPSKFKPQKPALRYAERHPREIAETAMDVDEEFVEEEDIDESDYIIDTYFRIPAEALETTDASKNIGLLILDSQPDIDEFYREHDEMDEEEEDDDEDENGEPFVLTSNALLT
jgi:hypothetical protein